MRPHKIKLLVDQLPVHNTYSNRILTVKELRDAEALRFATYYKDLAFGWKFANAMVDYNLAIPGMFDDEDYAVLVAYKFLTDPYYTHEDMAVAYSIYKDGHAFTKDLIEACLLANEVSYELIQNKTGIGANVVYLYEKLFFNVLDRKEDAYIIVQNVYPNTRMDMMYNDALEMVDQSLLMKRAGFHNGIDDVLYFAGFKDDALIVLTKSGNTAANLEGTIMANGLMLARNGWLNQRTVGVSQAKALIAAAKQGGEESSSTDELAPLSDSLMDAMFGEKIRQATEQLQFERDT